MPENDDASEKRIARIYYFYAPPVLWVLFALLLSSRLGDYDASVSLLYGVMAFAAPEYPRPDINGMYGVTFLFRRAAQVFVYGVLSLLLVRAVQCGAPRLRKRGILWVLILGTGAALLDNRVRSTTAGRHGGWDDLTFSLGSVALFAAGIALFFVLKAWERMFFGEQTAVPRVP